LRNKSPNTFSSGQKKKILLAQALVHNPDLLIMDEPVANLDPKARNDFFKLLDKLRKDGKAIFISSHVLAELQTYFDSCTILDGGKIVFSGSKDELIKKFPTDSYTLKSNETDTTKLKKVLTKTKVKYEYDEFNKNFRLSITKNDKIEKIQELIIKNKIFINYFSKNELTLEQAYEKMVVNGSVDTMKK
jgi:ABC-2 type transport system ATP-binding protein